MATAKKKTNRVEAIDTSRLPVRSGNPKGRPRGSRNMAEVFRAIMNAKMDITERNGRQRRMSRGIAMLHNVIDDDTDFVEIALACPSR